MRVRVTKTFSVSCSGNALEVGVKVVTNADVAAVVNVERRLNEGILTNFTHHVLEHGKSITNERIRGRIVREVAVVLVHHLARTESPIDQFGGETVVSAPHQSRITVSLGEGLLTRLPISSSHSRRTTVYWLGSGQTRWLRGLFLSLPWYLLDVIGPRRRRRRTENMSNNCSKRD